MADNPKLLQTLIDIMQGGVAPAFYLNKGFDVYNFAQALFKDVEDKRSSVTALTRDQASQLVQSRLQFSNTKHESRINCLYRLIGLPTELNMTNVNLLNANGDTLKNKDELEKQLTQREFEQLELTFKTFLQSNTTQDLNKQIDSFQTTEQKLIADLFDPNKINTNRLFPIVQYSQIQNVVETRSKVSPPFASSQERYVNNGLLQPPFLETVITIRLLKQSGGSTINTQGAVEDIILKALGFALAELVKQYQRIQTNAEKMLLDGIATIRPKPAGVNSAATKSADADANNRESTDIATKTESDIRAQYTQAQLKLYQAAIGLLPIENDIIPIGPDISGTPFQSRNIQNNALTHTFISIINANVDAINRAVEESKRVLTKKQLSQDKLTAQLGSIISDIGGISLAEIIIVISALFVMDEEDLIGLISDSRYDQLIGATNNSTSASSGTIDSSGNQNTADKQINIFDTLNQFQSSRTKTTDAIIIMQNIVKVLYDAFVKQLGLAHIINSQ